MQKNNATVTNAWCFYDWANSVYSLVITSTIFPIYFSAVAKNADGSTRVDFLGFHLESAVLFSYAISGAFLIIAALSPFLTAIADYSGRKKMFMQLFCYLGAFSCAGLYFFTRETFTLSVLLFVLASIGFSGSIVFYNSYLPEIATEDEYDRLSARGFSMGYVGSVLLLVFNLAMIMKPEWFGIAADNTSLPPRITFLSTGIWWFGFAQYTFYHLPANVYHRKPKGSWILNGFKELQGVVQQVKDLPLLKRFLLAYFFYNMGVQTVMYVATIFGIEELHLPDEALIVTILIIQLVAVAGAYAFAFLSGKFGNIRALMLAVVIWIGICVGAYFIRGEFDFYVLAAIVGSVMGGIQSLSRSTYSKLIPATTQDHASFFSFYDVTEKVSIVLGTLAYGAIAQYTGSMRNSILALIIFFGLGLVFLFLVKGKNTEESKQKVAERAVR
ncbi:UMF1 family MFS transporter [Pontibacter ummariensis]|uniref:MFS transporter, UMF1 family n=1 Tax=Pontibacter ummariensis TaxID=1610492 RepID=A0A239JVU7_9BACT|nr:MFS transporter [Pontibacter ummariensis]PRY07314.1 UMF1 family MFS transporter [Pontibacter ummariensis]SNT09839.1 MFS transporter, UMF1 family [Pontibacter ummariensis]